MIEILIRKDAKDLAEANASGKSLSMQLQDALNQKFPNSQFSDGGEDIVSGLVGKEFTKSAIIAITLAFIMMALYISFRYEFAYAMAALVALVHDVIIATGVYLLLGKEISLNVIAALLTTIGYSINDTIVVFDRIRENLALRKDLNYIQIISLSLNQTMPRTLLTSFTTFLVLIILLIFGGSAINDFVLVMLLGVIIGTYSSIFIASPLVALWHKHKGGIVDGDVNSSAVTAGEK
jgi:preprotein translocase SecF subunit